MISVDPKPSNIGIFKGSTIITPNAGEAQAASGISLDTEAHVEEAGRKLLNDLGCQAVLVTRSEHGMSLFEQNGPSTHIPTQAREVFDVTGAGDTVVATLDPGDGGRGLQPRSRPPGQRRGRHRGGRSRRGRRHAHRAGSGPERLMLKQFWDRLKAPGPWQKALIVALLSDALSFGLGLTFIFVWLVDFATAAILFAILGFRWALFIPIFIEAIPVLAVFPSWGLAVSAMMALDKDKEKKPS